ncbi:MAG: nitrile hydratase subunit beta [Gammaproteobacteria bacterium]
MPTLTADRVQAVLRKGSSARLAEAIPPRFRPGDRVLARNLHPDGHTRLPRYARGRVGVIDRDHGVFIFPDSHAVDGNRKPQHAYSVRFSAGELWGPQGGRHDVIFIDLWDDYLEPAP